MSLINDALKRAKDAQQKSPPAAAEELQLRPATAAPAPKSNLGMLVPLVAAVCAIAVLLLVWQGRQKTAARELTVEPKPVPTPATSIAKPTAAPAVQPPPIVAAIPAPVVQVAQLKPALAPAPAPVVTAPVFDLKLKAVFYTPGHPTAIINGKTVKVGTVIKGFRVAALTEGSATLVSATQTNVLTLEQ
jgi:hypothetical protein